MNTPQKQQISSSGDIVVHNNVLYLDELVMDMRDLNKDPGSLPHALRLVHDEIDRVWSVVYPIGVSNKKSIPAPVQATSPPRPLFSPESSSPIGPRPLFSPESAVSIMRPQLMSSRAIAHYENLPIMQRAYSKLFDSTDNPRETVIVHEKIPLPYCPNINFIGRILGPRGITVKQMESETGCRIFVRGRGSVKDPVREARLLNYIGWEHLTEPLHVLIEATDVSKAGAEAKLLLGVRAITPLLVPSNDEHKRRQMIQLAIINGTYRCDADF